MQRSKKAPGHTQWSVVAIAAVVAGVLLAVGIGIYLFGRGGTTGLDRPIKLPALATMQVRPFGNDVLFYDGMTLFCINTSGRQRWSFLVGQNAAFHASGKRVAAWSANQLYILDQNGQPTYNDRMSAEVQFARAGSRYVAAFVGERSNGTIHVLDNDGRSVDNMPINQLTPLDIGFFGDSPELMWVMSLDTGGTVPSVTMQTYDPGKLATGSTSLGEQLAYKVMYSNGRLRVVDTERIRTFDYKIIEDKNVPPILIYGWYLQDVRQVGRETLQLLVPTPQVSGQLQATDLRLLSDSGDRVLHLPAQCFGAVLGSKAVYGFSNSYVYMGKYGTNTFSAYTMQVRPTAVLGITQNDRVIVAAGSDVYLLPLPQPR